MVGQQRSIMGFTHKQPFADDDCYQSAYTHLRQLDYGGHLASFAEFSSLRVNSDTRPVSDGERDGSSSQSQSKVLGGDAGNILLVFPDEVESRAGDISNSSVASAPSDVPSLPLIMGGTSEVRSDHPKRPFRANGSCQVTVKRARQVDQDNQVDSFKRISSFNNSTVEGQTASVASVEVGKRIFSDVSENPGTIMSSSISNLTRLTCSTNEEDTRLETPRFSSFPGYFEDSHRPTRFNKSEELYSPVFDCPPRKLVPIGPNHQADVPLLRLRGSRKSLEESIGYDSSYSASAGQLMVDEIGSDKWLGTRVLPMSAAESLDLEASKMECYCRDDGSIRCVRQHVMAARERLKKMLGEDRFKELGFCGMGEVVAHKWTEEEEQLFNEVVISNPVASGKNFWEALPRAFPSRNTEELLSYYFNVFMLRKRAEQNRSDPLNVDSDNDEWQGSDDVEFLSTEEDEDSVIESPVDPDDVTCNNGENDIHEESEDEEEYEDLGITGEDNEELYGASRRCFDDKSESAPELLPVEMNSRDYAEYQDVQDDSCTSYEGQYNKVDPCGGHVDFVGIQDSLVGHMQYGNGRFTGISNHEYIVGHCDPKTWGISYVPLMEKDADFLPTCSVIQEVFGEGSWENNVKDSDII